MFRGVVTASELAVRWGDGTLRLRALQSSLEIHAANARILLEPRMMVVEGLSGGWMEALQGKYRWLYIDFEEPLRPLPPSVNATSRALMLGLYDARSINTGFESYLTIIVPGYFLYNYVVVASSRMGVETPAKRRLYVDASKNGLAVYLV